MPDTTPAPSTRPFLPLPLLVALFCVLWSSAFAAAKMALADCPPLLLLSTRLLLAGVIMLALAILVDGKPRMRWRDLGALALLGTLNNAVYLGFNWTAMTTASSAYSAVLASCIPLIVALFAGPLLGEHMNARKWAGLFLGLAGVAIVMRSRLEAGHEDMRGTLLIICGMLAISAGTLGFKYLKPQGGVWTGNALQCLAAGLVLAPIALASEDIGAVRITPHLLGGLAYLVIAISLGAYGLWFYLLTKSSATAASSLHFMMPPLGLFFGWLLLDEAIPPLDILGIVPIALGIWLVTKPPKAAKLQVEKPQPCTAKAGATCISASSS